MVTDVAAAPNNNPARHSAKRMALYAGVGPDPAQYDVDFEGAALIKRASVRHPASVQYAWPHAPQQYYYAVSRQPGSGQRTALQQGHSR